MKNISNRHQETSEEVFKPYSIKLEFTIGGKPYNKYFKLDGNIDVTDDDNIGNALNRDILDYHSEIMKCSPAALDFDSIWANVRIGDLTDYDPKLEDKVRYIGDIPRDEKCQNVLQNVTGDVVDIMKYKVGKK